MIDQLDAIELYYRLYGYLKQKNQEKPLMVNELTI